MPARGGGALVHQAAQGLLRGREVARGFLIGRDSQKTGLEEGIVLLRMDCEGLKKGQAKDAYAPSQCGDSHWVAPCGPPRRSARLSRSKYSSTIWR